jgi:hypothetical protein
MLNEIFNNDESDDLNDNLDIELDIDIDDTDIESNIIETDFDSLIVDTTTETGEVPTESVATTEVATESKHKIKGKHSLRYDSIFKGKKKEEDSDEDDEFAQDLMIPKQENFEFDTSSAYHDEVTNPEDYVRHKELKESIYNIIVEKTDINIKNSRRKPGRIDFNKYYQILIDNLDTSKFSYSEIFVDLSYYFSDNIFNMFKLLDKKWGSKIIRELAKKRNIKVDHIDFI